METETEALDPQKKQESEVSVKKVEVTEEELADLRHKAEVSSQNFERAKKAETKLAELEISKNEETSPEVFSDEGKVLQKQIEESSRKIEELTRENAKKDVLMAHPILREKWEEFEKFRSDPENKGMNLKTAAKAFLTESGLLDAPRKGLEKPTGGARTQPSPGMSIEEIKDLRENNWPKYLEMVKKGQIKT